MVRSVMTEDPTPDPKPAERRFRDVALPLRILVGIAFATIVTLTIAQVFFRFVLNSPLVWSEEVVRILLVWMTFIGAAVVCWDGRHLSVDVLFNRLPKGMRRVMRVFNAVVGIAFLAALAWYSIPLLEIGWYVGSGALDLPDAVLRAPAFVGGILMIAFILLRWFYRRPRESDTGDGSDTTDAI
jgi:TRAP-type transport system small permease protein